jgi:hypothetical protein
VFDEAGAIVSEAGAIADDEAGAIVSDEEAGAIVSDEEVGAIAEEELTTAALEEVVTTVVVGVPRLKIQMRPMITITTTMMIIQVLRFMGKTLCCVGWFGKNIVHA